jgi:hypothetical protein
MSALIAKRNPDGSISPVTDADLNTAAVLAMLRGDDVRSKGDLLGYKSADFSFAPERQCSRK